MANLALHIPERCTVQNATVKMGPDTKNLSPSKTQARLLSHWFLGQLRVFIWQVHRRNVDYLPWLSNVTPVLPLWFVASQFNAQNNQKTCLAHSTCKAQIMNSFDRLTAVGSVKGLYGAVKLVEGSDPTANVVSDFRAQRVLGPSGAQDIAHGIIQPDQSKVCDWLVWVT